MNQKNKVYIGIDPGLKGAIVALKFGTAKEKLGVATYPLEIKNHNVDIVKAQAWLSNFMLLYAISSVPKSCEFFGCIEKTWNVSKGSIAISKLNYTAGALNAMLALMDIPVIQVAPVTWKKRVIGNYRASKEDTIRWVHKTFPEVNLLRTLKSKKDDDNLADAIAIAYYAMLQD